MPRQTAAAAFELQQIFRDGPALVLGADAIALGHAHVVEEHLIDFVVAGKKVDRPHGDAGTVHVEQQERDAALGLAGEFRPHQRKHAIRVVRVGRPDLAAIQHILVAVLVSAQCEGGKVRTCAGFRVALAPVVFAGQDARQIERLLFGRAVADQCRTAHAESHWRDTRHIRQRALGRPQIALHEVPARAAMFLRPRRRDPALLIQDAVPADVVLVFLEHAGPKARRLAQFTSQFALEEAAHFQAEGFVFRGEIHIHVGAPGNGERGGAPSVAARACALSGCSRP